MTAPGFEFAAPAQIDSWDKQIGIGHLFVVDVHGQGPAEQTQYGVAEPIIATVHDIDAATTVEHVKIFTGSLISALKPRIGSKILAVLTQGAAKPGKSAPYLLEDRSTDPRAAQRATAYLKAWQSGQYTAPAPQPQPPQQAAATGGIDVNDPAVAAALQALQQQGLTGKPPF